MVMESAESSALLSYAWSQAGLDAVKTRGYMKTISHQTANKFRSITAFMFRSTSPNTACAIETFRRRHRTDKCAFWAINRTLPIEKRLRYAEGKVIQKTSLFMFVLRDAQIS